MGRIPWTAARDYARHLGLSRDLFDLFWHVITRMDGVYVEFHLERMRQGGKGREG